MTEVSGKIKTRQADYNQKRKALPWFRFYAEAIDDPKVQRLAPNLFKTWVNLLCIASQSGGILPSIDDIAFRLRMSVHDAEQQISDLILAGLIDITDAGRSPHNWSGRQFQSDCSTERVRKHRRNKVETQCNVSETPDEAPPEQSRAETEQKTEPRDERAREFDVKGGKVAKSPRAMQRANGELDGSQGSDFTDGKLTVTNGAASALVADYPGIDLAAVCAKAGPEIAKFGYPSRADALAVLRKWAQIATEARTAPRYAKPQDVPHVVSPETLRYAKPAPDNLAAEYLARVEAHRA